MNPGLISKYLGCVCQDISTLFIPKPKVTECEQGSKDLGFATKVKLNEPCPPPPPRILSEHTRALLKHIALHQPKVCLTETKQGRGGRKKHKSGLGGSNCSYTSTRENWAESETHGHGTFYRCRWNHKQSKWRRKMPVLTLGSEF